MTVANAALSGEVVMEASKVAPAAAVATRRKEKNVYVLTTG